MLWNKKKIDTDSKFKNFADDFYPIFNDIAQIAITLNQTQRKKLTHDFIEIFYLINSEYNITSDDGWVCMLMLVAVKNCENFQEKFNKIKNEEDLEALSTKLKNKLIEEKAEREISFQNFSLESFEDLSIEDANILRKVFINFSCLLAVKDNRDENSEESQFIQKYLIEIKQEVAIEERTNIQK